MESACINIQLDITITPIPVAMTKNSTYVKNLNVPIPCKIKSRTCLSNGIRYI